MNRVNGREHRSGFCSQSLTTLTRFCSRRIPQQALLHAVKYIRLHYTAILHAAASSVQHRAMVTFLSYVAGHVQIKGTLGPCAFKLEFTEYTLARIMAGGGYEKRGVKRSGRGRYLSTYCSGEWSALSCEREIQNKHGARSWSTCQQLTVSSKQCYKEEIVYIICCYQCHDIYVKGRVSRKGSCKSFRNPPRPRKPRVVLRFDRCSFVQYNIRTFLKVARFFTSVSLFFVYVPDTYVRIDSGLTGTINCMYIVPFRYLTISNTQQPWQQQQ